MPQNVKERKKKEKRKKKVKKKIDLSTKVQYNNSSLDAMQRMEVKW